LDADENGECRYTTVDRHRPQKLGIPNYFGRSANAHNLPSLRDDEHEPDLRVLEDVQETISTTVASTVCNTERLRVKELDQTRRITFWCHVHSSVPVGSTDDHERRSFDPCSAMVVDMVDYFLRRDLRRLAE